ncbi:hypothetical protein [Bremerella volcania]|uniref:hypothetical protein n=1 Tax=Bremerella volcania TaxID=2527984 RepID=UPI00119DD63B|nr:hypothetical protein [Bremerella volcania]
MRTQTFRRDQASRLRDNLAENHAIDRGNKGRLSHLTQGQMLAKQTAVNDDAMRVFAGVPAGHFMRNRFNMGVTMMMSVIMVVMAMIFSSRDGPMEMTRQVRVLTARPGMDYLTKKLHHQIGGNQGVTAELPHDIPG